MIQDDIVNIKGIQTITGKKNFKSIPSTLTSAPGTSNKDVATNEFVINSLSNVVSQTITNGVTTSSPSQDAVFDALVLKADATTVTNKVTKGGDTDGSALVIGTNDANNVIIRRSGAQKILIDAIGTSLSTALSGGDWTAGNMNFGQVGNSTTITSGRTDSLPTLVVQNSGNTGTADLLQLKKSISGTLTTVSGLRSDGRVYGSDATASNDFITKGQYDIAKAIVDSALTTTQTAATLNAKYPSVPLPYVVFAPNVLSSMTYVKVNATQWMSYSGVLLS